MNYRISFDPEDQQLDVIHGYLSRSYWAEGIPRATVAKSVTNSFCVGAYDGDAQVGFARLITDRATFAYLADVFVLPEVRGQGVSKALMAAIMAHPDTQKLRRFALATSDAHALYAQYGFTPLARPQTFMERYKPDAYLD